jgi:hypothetical protein
MPVIRSVVVTTHTSIRARVQPVRIRLVDRVVRRVGVTVPTLRPLLVEYGVDGGEPANPGVIVACADLVWAGSGVGGFVEEASVVGPGGGGAAGVSIGGVLAPGGVM